MTLFGTGFVNASCAFYHYQSINNLPIIQFKLGHIDALILLHFDE